MRIAENQGPDVTPRRELDVYALWKFAPKAQFRLTLENLLREAYTNKTNYLNQFGSLRKRAIITSSIGLRANLALKL